MSVSRLTLLETKDHGWRLILRRRGLSANEQYVAAFGSMDAGMTYAKTEFQDTPVRFFRRGEQRRRS